MDLFGFCDKYAKEKQDFNSTVGFDASAVTSWWVVDPTWDFKWMKKKKKKIRFLLFTHKNKIKQHKLEIQLRERNKGNHKLKLLMETNGQSRQKPECLNTNEEKMTNEDQMWRLAEGR